MEEADNSTVRKTTVNGVDIIEEGDVTHFVISEDESSKIDESKNSKKNDEKKESFFTKLKNWMKKSNFRPYVKVRDFADPFGDRINDPSDYDAGCDGAKGAEIGIKFDF